MSMHERPPSVIANAIRMKCSQHPTRAYLVVEGFDDKAFFGRYIDPAGCKIEVAHGRCRVVDAILELDKTQFRGALGIVDADFETLEQRPPPSANIVVTDLHDIECMMVASPALSHLLREHGQEALIESFQAANGKLVDHVLSIGKALGYLRWASARHQWSLKFEGLEFTAFVRERDFSFDQRQLFEELRRHQGGYLGTVPLVSELEARVDELKNPAHDSWHVCCGHDLVALLSVGLRKVLGKNNESDVRADRLEQQLRLAYEQSYFLRTALHASILTWQQLHPPFRVLAPASA
jgi:hypothetical protein